MSPHRPAPRSRRRSAPRSASGRYCAPALISMSPRPLQPCPRQRPTVGSPPQVATKRYPPQHQGPPPPTRPEYRAIPRDYETAPDSWPRPLPVPRPAEPPPPRAAGGSTRSRFPPDLRHGPPARPAPERVSGSTGRSSPRPRPAPAPPSKAPQPMTGAQAVSFGGPPFGPCQQPVQIVLGQIDVIKQLVEVAHIVPQIARPAVRIQKPCHPFQANDPVQGRGPVDPAERGRGRKINPPEFHRVDLLPQRVIEHTVVKCAVPCDDDFRVGHDHLFDRGAHKPTGAAPFIGHVTPAGAFD